MHKTFPLHLVAVASVGYYRGSGSSDGRGAGHVGRQVAGRRSCCRSLVDAVGDSLAALLLMSSCCLLRRLLLGHLDVPVMDVSLKVSLREVGPPAAVGAVSIGQPRSGQYHTLFFLCTFSRCWEHLIPTCPVSFSNQRVDKYG